MAVEAADWVVGNTKSSLLTAHGEEVEEKKKQHSVPQGVKKKEAIAASEKLLPLDCGSQFLRLRSVAANADCANSWGSAASTVNPAASSPPKQVRPN